MASTLEQAFELAKSGECQTVEDIKRQLCLEKYDQVISHLEGQSKKRQLITLLIGKRAGGSGVDLCHHQLEGLCQTKFQFIA